MLKNTKFKFEQLIEIMPGHVYWLDRNNNYLGCNVLQAKTFGLSSPKEIVGKTNYDFIENKAEADAINTINLQVMELGIPHSTEEKCTFEKKENIYFSQRIPIRDKYNKVIGMLGISIDITERKREEDALREKIEEVDLSLERILSHLPAHVYWKNKEGKYLGCNDIQAQTLGLNFGREVVGKTDFELPWSKGVAKAFWDNDQRIMKTGISDVVEEIVNVHGQEMVVLSSKTPLKNREGQIIGIIGISVDITQQKENERKLMEAKEKAEVANKAKTEFLENMRHDIRTPVSGIVSLANLLQNEKDNSKIQKYTIELAEASNELLRFLNEILETINVASGEIPLVKKKFNLKTILENVLKLHQPKANEQCLELTFTFDPNIPRYLIGDSIRIYRILLELVVNALKFTKEGRVDICAVLAKKEERDIVIKIEIRDTGPGIPVEKQQELFIRFKRLIPSYQGIYKGTGLGLSTVKQFIDDLQGEIYYESNQNKGAKFTCLIPLKESLLEDNLGEDNYHSMNLSESSLKLEPKKIKPLNQEKCNILSQKIHILIVEDQVLAANVVKDLLTKLECEADIASDGATAIELIKQNHYDLVFIDIGLPDIDGYEVTENIRLHENNFHHRVPIIGLTAHVDKDKKQQGLDVGMNLVLTKPLMQETAIAILKNYIPSYSLESDHVTNNYKLIDFETAKRTLGNSNHELVTKRLKIFIDSFEEECNKLDLAYFKQDWSSIREIVHKLKGGCYYCGAYKLKDVCDQLINYIGQKNPELRESFYQQMRREMQSLKYYMENNDSFKEF